MDKPDDEYPTSRDGYDAQPDPSRRRARTQTPVQGVPVMVIERPSRAIPRPHPDEDSGEHAQGALDPLDARIDARFERHATRRFRRLWRGVAAVAGTAVIALGAAGKAALDDARTEGADRIRLQIIERDLERARLEIDSLRASVYASQRWRRDDQPDPRPPPPKVTP